MQQIERVGQHAILFAMIRQEIMGAWVDSKLGSPNRFNIDTRARVFSFYSDQGEIRCRGQVVASIARDPATLLWGYDKLFTTGDAEADQFAQGIHDFGLRHNLTEFSTSEVPYSFDPARESPEDAIARVSHEVGYAAVEIFGPSFHYYSMPSRANRIVLVLDRWEGGEPPAVTLIDVTTKLPRLLEWCTDIPWSLDGLVRMLPGWTLASQAGADANTTHWRIADNTGSWITAEIRLNQYGQVEYTKVTSPQQG